MTQTSQEKTCRGQFVQFPLHLIYERKDLSRDDKWVLLAIMGRCWTEGPHRLSYREIASLSEVPVTLLTSYDDKTGRHHEGIIDRLARLGDISIERGKEVNAMTGKPKGQTQTYIHINYTALWQQNINYCEARKSSTVEPYRVNKEDYQSVSNANTSVSITNTSDCDRNDSVSNTNASVSNTNKSVCDLPSKVTTYITDNTYYSDSKIENVSASADSTPASAEHHQPYEKSVSLPQLNNNPIATADTTATEDAAYDAFFAPYPPEEEKVAPAAELSTPVVEKPSRSRKPGKPKEPAVSPERIEAVFDCLDKMARQVTGDASFKYDRSTKTSREKVAELLKDRIVTQEALEAVYLELWNTPPDEKTGFDWQKNMSVKAICNNFERVWLSIKGKIQTKQAQTQNGQKVSAAVKAGYTDYTNSPPVEYRPLRMPNDRKRA